MASNDMLSNAVAVCCQQNIHTKGSSAGELKLRTTIWFSEAAIDTERNYNPIWHSAPILSQCLNKKNQHRCMLVPDFYPGEIRNTKYIQRCISLWWIYLWSSNSTSNYITFSSLICKYLFKLNISFSVPL